LQALSPPPSLALATSASVVQRGPSVCMHHVTTTGYQLQVIIQLQVISSAARTLLVVAQRERSLFLQALSPPPSSALATGTLVVECRPFVCTYHGTTTCCSAARMSLFFCLFFFFASAITTTIFGTGNRHLSSRAQTFRLHVPRHYYGLSVAQREHSICKYHLSPPITVVLDTGAATY
jgi:hypothetical protein